jgi:ZIP family zinc transporter
VVGYLSVLALILLPAAGNVAGGGLAEVIDVSQRALSLALHVAAGIVLAVVGVELMPMVLNVNPPWVSLVVLVAGSGFTVLVDEATEFIRTRTNSTAVDSGSIAIYFGTAVDLFSDGLLIATGTTINLGLGLLLALGQVPADIPEGFASIATFEDRGVERRTRLLLSVSYFVPVFIGGTIGYWIVRGQPEIIKLSVLAFTAGILLTVAVEEMVPEAHESADTRTEGLALVGGFVLFTFLSIYLG